MSKRIRLSESELNRMVYESVCQVLNEENMLQKGANRIKNGVKNFGNKMRKAWNGYTGEYDNQINNLQSQNQDLQGQYDSLRQDYADVSNDRNHLYNATRNFDIDRRAQSHDRVNNAKHKNHRMAKGFGLVRDLEQEVEQDVQEFGLKNKEVNWALGYVDKEVKNNPEKFNLPVNDQQVMEPEQERQIGESIDRAIRKTMKQYINY